MKKKYLYLSIFISIIICNTQSFTQNETMPETFKTNINQETLDNYEKTITDLKEKLGIQQKAEKTLEEKNKKIEARDKVIKSLHNIMNKQTKEYQILFGKYNVAKQEIKDLKKVWDEKNWPNKYKKSLQIIKNEKNKLNNEKKNLSQDMSNLVINLDEINQMLPEQLTQVKNKIKINQITIKSNDAALKQNAQLAKEAKKKIKAIEKKIQEETGKETKNFDTINNLYKEFKKRVGELNLFEGRVNGASSKILRLQETNKLLEKIVEPLQELQIKIEQTKKISKKYKQKSFFSALRERFGLGK